MTTYRIIHYTNDNPIGTDVYKTNVFRQTELQSQFNEVIKKLQDDESVEFMKEDDKRFSPSMQFVVKEKGVLYSYTAAGHKKRSQYNSLIQ